VTTRARLTLLFAGMAVAISILLAAALLLARSSYLYSDLGRHASLQAQMTARLIEGAAQAGDSLTVENQAGATVLAPRLQQLLERFPGLLIVLDSSGTPLFTSRAVVELSLDDWDVLRSGLTVVPADGPAGLLPAAGGTLLVARSVDGRPEGITRVVAGVSTAGVQGVPREYAVTLVFVLPLVILSAMALAHVVLSKPFQELDRIAEEVAAITDGRSLHRRLAMRERRGELSRLVATLNAMIARLETSFMALRRFTADASHELKTPLAVLRADVERAMSDRTSPHERAVALEEALQEIARMTELVESLLTLARADEGRFDLVLEPVELAPLVQEVYETAVILGEQAGVSVTLPFATEATVFGDRNRLRQLFLNLITNAIKYTHPGGRVDIGLGKHPDHVAFAVRDTGMGIAAADVPHIFDRFWRADRARSRPLSRLRAERGGFGLGLAISQWIAQAHGGTLTVSSRLGVGSLFTVTLPLRPEDQTAPAASMEEAAVS
jgi:two-component system OmpR family sensor kinase